MALKWRENEMKTVTHVYAHFVTHVFAPCREEALVINFPSLRTQLVGDRRSTPRYPAGIGPKMRPKRSNIA